MNSPAASRFLNEVGRARVEHGPTSHQVVFALEDACTTICLGGEMFVRSVDIEKTFNELHACLTEAQSSMDVLVLTCRTIASVADVVPRAAHSIRSHRLFVSVNELAHSLQQLVNSEPLAEELTRIMSILCTESRDAMLSEGALTLMLTYLAQLPMRFRSVCLRTVTHLCGGLHASQGDLGTQAVEALVKLSLECLDFTVAHESASGTSRGRNLNVNLNDRPPTHVRHLSVKQAEVVEACCAAFAHVVDRTCITAADALALMANGGGRALNMINYLISWSAHFGTHGRALGTTALATICAITISIPEVALATFVTYGTVQALSKQFLDTITSKGTVELENRRTKQDVPPSVLDVLQLILPGANGADAGIVSITTHKWEWEDDFRNHNTFDDANCDLVENEYQVQRKKQQWAPVVITHAHRPSMLSLNVMRQGYSMPLSRPIFRSPLPFRVDHRQCRVPCTCQKERAARESASLQDNTSQGIVDSQSHGGTADFATLQTDEPDHRRERSDDSDAGEKRGGGFWCCSRFFKPSKSDAGSASHQRHERSENRSHNRNSGRERRDRPRLNPSSRSNDIRETSQLSGDLRHGIAKDTTCVHRLLLCLFPAAIAVIRSTVDQALVRVALTVVLRILALVKAGGSAGLRTILKTNSQHIVTCLTVALRTALIGVVHADMTATANALEIAAAVAARGAKRAVWQTPGWNGDRDSDEAPTSRSVNNVLTTRGIIIELAAEGLFSLCEILGAEHVVDDIKVQRLDGHLSALCVYLDRFDDPDFGFDPNKHSVPLASLDASASSEAPYCPAHETERRVAQRLRSAIAPLADIIGSNCSSPISAMPTTLDETIIEITNALLDPQATPDDLWRTLMEVNTACSDNAKVSSFAADATMHPRFLVALKDAVEVLRTTTGVVPSNGADRTAAVGCLRDMLWKILDANITSVNVEGLTEVCTSTSTNSKAHSRVSRSTKLTQATAVRQQIIDHLARPVVLKVSPTSRLRVPKGLRDHILECRADVHVNFMPLAPMPQLGVCIEQRIRQRLWNGVRSSDHHHASSESRESASAAGSPIVIDPAASASFSTSTSEQRKDVAAAAGNDDFEIFLVMPGTGAVVRPASSRKLIDALYYFHPSADGLRHLVEWPLSRKPFVSRPFQLWHTVIGVEYFAVPKRFVADRSICEATDDDGFAPHECCSMRHLGFPVCSPLHAFRDAAVADPLAFTATAIQALGSLEAFAPSATAPSPERVRLSSAVAMSVQLHAVAFQGSFLAQLQLDTPPLLAPSPPHLKLASFIRATPVGSTSRRSRSPQSHNINATLAHRVNVSGNYNNNNINNSNNNSNTTNESSEGRSPSEEPHFLSPHDGSPDAAARTPISPLMAAFPPAVRSERTPPEPLLGRSNGGVNNNNNSWRYGGADGQLLDAHLPLAVLALAPHLVPLDLRQSLLRKFSVIGALFTPADERSRGGGGLHHHRSKVTVMRESVGNAGRSALKRHPLPSDTLEITFGGEVGTGPGVANEFFVLYARTLVVPSDGATWIRNHDGLLYPAPPAADPRLRQRQQDTYEHLGRLIARCLAEDRTIDVPLHPLAWDALAGRDLTAHPSWALRQLDAPLASSLELVHDMFPQDFDALDLCWTLPGHDSIGLIPYGAETTVKYSDRGKYIRAVQHFWLVTTARHFASGISKGVADVMPPLSFAMFDSTELDRWLRGAPGLLWDSPSAFLASIACDHGYTFESPAVVSLAKVVASFDHAGQRDFLRFVTGSDCMPAKGLVPKITVVRRDVDAASTAASPAPELLPGALMSLDLPVPPYRRSSDAQGDLIDKCLPTVNTCFHYLKLPAYGSLQVLRERLLYALQEGHGAFHLS